MPDTKQPVADPYGLMHWVSAMRDAGDLAPMLIVVRDSTVLASGFVDPAGWGAAMGIALYGFGASAVVGVMDSWIILGDSLPDRLPRDAFEAGDPNAAEALQLLWVPRAGEIVALCRTYTATDAGLSWDVLAEYERSAWTVSASGVQKALRQMSAAYPDDEFADVPQVDRDAATAKYLGLELR